MDVMIDIETGGTRPGSVIYSLGAVIFDSFYGPQTWQVYYSAISRQSCLAHGLVEDVATVAWWEEQGDEARKVLDAINHPKAPDLPSVLKFLNAWICENKDDKAIRVWGNAASFDITLIEEAMRFCGIKPVWSYKGVMCYRTLKNLLPHIPLVEVGKKHNALHDAMNQATHCVRLLEVMSQAPFIK